ncbi:MAG TPA: hypothetical protein VF365_00815 [Candidatus Limnocylindria bacterium]
MSDPPRGESLVAGWRVGRLARPSGPGIDALLPFLIVVGLLAGLAVMSALSPIAARGDYGQWLMTSRYYLGESVPDYRTITALPPIIPGLIAGVRLVVPDPIVALHVVTIGLLVGMGAAFYLGGTLAFASRWVGLFSAVVALLVTDRFLELFAFGGLLQAASMLCMCLSIGAFAAAGRQRRIVLGWWLLGTAAMALAALTHVGTGMIAVPAGMAAAGLSALTLRRLGWEPLRRALLLPMLAAAGVAAYWLIVLLPASGDYLTNPASLAYRGPDRLFSALFSYWPTTAVVIVGGVGIFAGATADLAQRRIGGFSYLAAWIVVTWGALAFSVVTGVATDYPRFATLLLAPLAVSAGAVVAWLIDALDRRFSGIGPRHLRGHLVPAVFLLAILAAAPITTGRYERQVSSYQPREATSLTAAIEWVDAALADDRAVLTEVRDGKWLEGLTGREALFSQPVRYAFRSGEWQRSSDADALLRSSATLTSGYVTALFIDAVGSERRVPSDLLVRTNHGGEFVDVLRLPPRATSIAADGPGVTADGLVPIRTAHDTTERAATVRTVWERPGEDGFTFIQAVTTYVEGTTVRILQQVPGHRLSTVLSPAFGVTMTTLEIAGSEAVACFTELGGTAPCVRINAAQPDARLRATSDGGLEVDSGTTSRIDLLITALTAGDASVGLGLLQPAELVEAYDVGAALLNAADPSYPSRRARLESLGFEEARTFGPYRVLLRSGSPSR